MKFDKAMVYKPFSNYEKMKKVIIQHKSLIKNKLTGQEAELVYAFGNLEKMRHIEFVVPGLKNLLPLEELCKNYVFADDGTPCGEMVTQ
ncbi:hypothetical protein [Treponema pedis]|uniref:hypothetical protein n=1 Tax=Treponema pedis TaxID=409322 RepID=UPI003D255549